MPIVNNKKWVRNILIQELKKVPKRILEKAREEKNTREIVYSSVTRKGALNPENELVKREFNKLINRKVIR